MPEESAKGDGGIQFGCCFKHMLCISCLFCFVHIEFVFLRLNMYVLAPSKLVWNRSINIRHSDAFNFRLFPSINKYICTNDARERTSAQRVCSWLCCIRSIEIMCVWELMKRKDSWLECNQHLRHNTNEHFENFTHSQCHC